MMIPVCDSYLAEATERFRIAAVQGVGIVFLGNFSGMVVGFMLSPPTSINVSKTVCGSLFGGLVGISVALTLILKKTRELINNESD
ncbi:MAG: hypothetical protein AAFS12_00720 [Cyanobacteria bacterium J06632_19]